MFVTRQNLKGGPKLKSCPIDIDQRSGRVGYKMCYCAGCNEPLFMGLGELREILDYFEMGAELKSESIREKIVHLLGGTILDK